MSSTTTMTSSPASLALDAFLIPSNKRVKRSTADSPAASFSFDMSELFAASNAEEAFPSIAWSFDDNSEDDTASVSSACTNTSTSSLGKRSHHSSGLSRSKTTSSSLELLG